MNDARVASMTMEPPDEFDVNPPEELAENGHHPHAVMADKSLHRRVQTAATPSRLHEAIHGMLHWGLND
jgi:hypothetical protein